jgi:hypothetical protein
MRRKGTESVYNHSKNLTISLDVSVSLRCTLVKERSLVR